MNAPHHAVSSVDSGTDNVRIVSSKVLPSPAVLKQTYPTSSEMAAFVAHNRTVVENILAGTDARLLVVIGPCAIRTLKETIRYAEFVAEMQQKHPWAFFVMRTCIDKPRTTDGWRGLADQPIPGPQDRGGGLSVCRRILSKLTEMKIPVGFEILSPYTAHCLGDLATYAWVGARNATDCNLRYLVSGLSMPCGFKNGVDGGLLSAVQAVKTARKPHQFDGPDDRGLMSVFQTTGNQTTHVILRGGKTPNYDKNYRAEVASHCRDLGIKSAIVIDASHGNSNKDPHRQADVLRSVILDRRWFGSADERPSGIMIESDLNHGSKSCDPTVGHEEGFSITDPCLGIDGTRKLLNEAASLR